MTEALSYFNIFDYGCGSASVFFGMAISAQNLKVVFAIVFSITILVVNNKHGKSIFIAPFAKNKAMPLNAACVSNNGIFDLTIFCRPMKRGACSGAKSTKSPVGLIPSRDNSSACLAWVSLDAFNGAIFTLPTQTVCGKYATAPFAYSTFLHRMVSTFARAIKLALALTPIVPLKQGFANQALIHGGGYAAA
jgi:hypothetical protein